MDPRGVEKPWFEKHPQTSIRSNQQTLPALSANLASFGFQPKMAKEAHFDTQSKHKAQN